MGLGRGTTHRHLQPQVCCERFARRAGRPEPSGPGCALNRYACQRGVAPLPLLPAAVAGPGAPHVCSFVSSRTGTAPRVLPFGDQPGQLSPGGNASTPSAGHDPGNLAVERRSHHGAGFSRPPVCAGGTDLPQHARPGSSACRRSGACVACQLVPGTACEMCAWPTLAVRPCRSPSSRSWTCSMQGCPSLGGWLLRAPCPLFLLGTRSLLQVSC